MIHIYWGIGKGKSSALNGMALRAKGADLRVGVFRFLKGRETSEDKVLRGAGINVWSFHTSNKFVMEMSPEEAFKSRSDALSGMRYIAMNRKNYDMIIMDEILDLCASNVNFVTEKQLIEFLDSLGNDVEIILSGHTLLNNLFNKADLITEFKASKHYFEKGIKARKGIEF